jgi:hypothetical protein
MDTMDAGAVTVVPQVVVAVAMVVVVAVVVVVPLLSIELQSLEESAIFIGPLELVIAALTVLSSTKQSLRSRDLLPPHHPQIILQIFSP